MALPALLRWMLGARAARAVAAAAAAALAGAAIALAGSRAELALGALVLAYAAATSQRSLGASRLGALMSAGIPLGAGVAARVAVGGYAFPGATGGDLPRLLVLAAIPVAAVAAWHLARRFLQRRSLRPGPGWGRRRRVAAVAVLAAVLAGAVTLEASASNDRRPWVEPASGFSHGRTAQWEAAFDTVADRPILGSGSEAYGRASAGHQGGAFSIYAHDLPLEAWAELGLLGLALVCALYGCAGWLVWRIRNRPEAWFLAPAVVAFLLANLVDWPWHLAGIGATWALALGGCIALGRGARRT
jgi:O-antigen ligase